MSYVNTIWRSENDSATKIVHVSKLKPPAVPDIPPDNVRVVRADHARRKPFGSSVAKGRQVIEQPVLGFGVSNDDHDLVDMSGDALNQQRAGRTPHRIESRWKFLLQRFNAGNQLRLLCKLNSEFINGFRRIRLRCHLGHG